MFETFTNVWIYNFVVYHLSFVVQYVQQFRCLDIQENEHNIPNCMKEVTWLMLCLSTNGHW